MVYSEFLRIINIFCFFFYFIDFFFGNIMYLSKQLNINTNKTDICTDERSKLIYHFIFTEKVKECKRIICSGNLEGKNACSNV